MGTKITKTIKKKQLIQNKGVTVKKDRLFIVDHPFSKPSLYQFVYSSTFSFFCTSLLISSFLLQGVVTVYADDSLAPDSVVGTDISSPRDEVVDVPMTEDDSSLIETLAKESPIETAVVSAGSILNSDLTNTTSTDLLVAGESDDEVIPESDTETTSSPFGEVDNGDDTQTSDSGGIDTTIIDANDSEGSNAASENVTDESGVATSTDGSLPESDEVSSEVSDPEVSSQAATSSPSDAPVHINYDDNEFKFNKQECTELASGSFYCLKPHETGLEDALFAAPDVDGDLEIFLIRDGVQVQITNNTVDDASPFYDQNSNSLVWHKLIDDRYQIISYDLDDRKERQLTTGSTNNMEPVRQGKYTVWQRWIGTSWDVVLHDGTKEEILTESSAHDIAPYIHGSLVVWNRYNSSQEKTIEMYDIKSATYVSVNDPEGLSVSNPRMVFVYDSLHPNGDIVTKGFDMITKEFISLDTLPRSLPEELPPIDSTGETRALIQSKPTMKSEVEELSSTGTSTPGIVPSIDPTDPLTLDLAFATSTFAVAPVPIFETAALTLDLSQTVVSSAESAISSDLELVVAPYTQP